MDPFNERELALLEMIADPSGVVLVDQDHPVAARLKELGLARAVIANALRWEATEAGLREVELRRPVGICATCRTPQRWESSERKSVVCSRGHIDKPTRTPCSVCAELDTMEQDPACKVGLCDDPPPEHRCNGWKFAGHDIERRVRIGLYEP